MFDTDFHIYLTAQSYTNTNRVVGFICEYGPSFRGPRFALVNFNTIYSWTAPADNSVLTYYIEEAMQGFLQVFGLNAGAHQYWYDSNTNLFYVPSAM